MSIAALDWAINRCIGLGLSANDKLVLWQLADAHNPEHGCFIGQETIAKRAEVGRATVNRCLDRLEELRLIERQRRVDKATGRQLATKYFLAFEKGEQPQDVVSRVSKRDTEIAGPSGEQPGADPVDNSPDDEAAVSQTVSHSSETLTLEPITPLPPDDAAEAQFDELLGKYPATAIGNGMKATAAWADISPADRARAVALASEYRMGCYALGRTVPPLAEYLGKRLWAEYDDDPPPIQRDHFRITKTRPEWREWMRWVTRNFSPNTATRTEQQGFLLTKTRWPEPDKRRAEHRLVHTPGENGTYAY